MNLILDSQFFSPAKDVGEDTTILGFPTPLSGIHLLYQDDKGESVSEEL